MKRNFRNEKGEIITRKKWFLSNYSRVSMPEVTNEFNMIDTRLKHFEEYATEKLSKIELAIFAATAVKVSQEEGRAVYINMGGYVDVEFQYSASNPNRENVFNSLRDEFQKRYERQLELKVIADSTWVEIPEGGAK